MSNVLPKSLVVLLVEAQQIVEPFPNPLAPDDPGYEYLHHDQKRPDRPGLEAVKPETNVVKELLELENIGQGKVEISTGLPMWPIHVLVNKFLKSQEETVGESGGDCSSLERCSSFLQQYMHDCHDAILPSSHFVEVPHIGQLGSWDCGLACVLMVLRTVGIEDCDIHVLRDLCNTTSIWTVDLAYLLQKFSVSFSFFTVTLGANPDFSMEKFYKEQLPTDLVRVDRLFKKSIEAGIDIECRSVSGEELSILIRSGNYIAIVLVDQFKLSRSWLEDVCVSGLYGIETDYTGHFVVICGYDADNNEFDIRDPASSRKYERVSLNCLEAARKSFGTDEDLLLISLKKIEEVYRTSS